MEAGKNPEVPDYCDTRPGKWVKVVRAMIGNLDYGEVQLTVHHGEVVEVRKLEKFRFDDRAGPPAGRPQ